MQKTIGSILSVSGLVLLVYTFINYLNESESFSALGADVMISKGNITPVIISAAILILGIIVLLTARKS